MSKKLSKFKVEELEQRFEMGWGEHSTEITASTSSGGSVGVKHTVKW